MSKEEINNYIVHSRVHYMQALYEAFSTHIREGKSMPYRKLKDPRKRSIIKNHIETSVKKRLNEQFHTHISSQECKELLAQPHQLLVQQLIQHTNDTLDKHDGSSVTDIKIHDGAQEIFDATQEVFMSAL